MEIKILLTNETLAASSEKSIAEQRMELLWKAESAVGKVSYFFKSLDSSATQKFERLKQYTNLAHLSKKDKSN